MIDLKLIEKDPNAVLENLQNRGQYDLAENIWNIISLNANIKSKTFKRNNLIEEKNTIHNEFDNIKSEDKDTAEQKLKIEKINKEIEEAELLLESEESNRKFFLMMTPNILCDDVPKGIKEEDDKVISTWQKGQILKKNGKEHLQIANTINPTKGTKISGTKFSILMGKIASLERAIGNFFMDFQIYHGGYKEVSVPIIVNKEALEGTGQIPKFENDLLPVGKNMFLIPAAEVPITNMYRDEILKEEDLPIKIVAHTTCFRSEVDSDEIDIKDLTRQHQFNKVELVWITKPETSDKNYEDLLSDIEAIIRELGLSYRVVFRCGGKTPFSASKCYDVEVWLPSQNKYIKVSSVSQFGDFQARRLNIKFKEKEKGKKSRLVNTLNGSALDVGITLVAILEHCVQKDGTIKVPAILVPYTKFSVIEF
jgi:seryl-tRNA synthetase